MDLRYVARLLPLVLVTACTTDLSVPPDAQITCASTSECPAEYVCLVSIRTCIRKDGDVTLPYIEGATVTPNRATRGSTVSIALLADSVQAAPPKVTLTWNGDTPGSAEATFRSLEGRTYVFSYTVGDVEPEGSLALHADVVSVAGVPNTYDQPNVLQLDFAAPVLVADTNVIQLPATPLLAAPSAAGLGTTITALFAANETLTSDIVVATSAPANIVFTCEPPLGTFYTCRATVDASMTEQGTYALVANVTDLAGNPAALTIGTFDLDTLPPASPRVDVPGFVTLLRAPHGSDASAGLPQLSVVGASGAVEPGLVVIAYDGPDPASSILIARATAMADGSLSGFVLPGVDRKTVYVQAVDRAGNGSPSVRINDGAWTATIGGKIPGNTFTNANVLSERRLFNSVRDGEVSEPASPTLLQANDGQRLTTYGGPSFLLGPQNDDHPSVRGDCRMVYDSIHGHQILFGGFWQTYNSGPGVDDETWTFDGFTWRQVHPQIHPAARAGHGMAFDKSRATTVVFGGCAGDNSAACSSLIGDTWTFDGTIWTRACWPGCTSEQCSCTSMPSPRTNAQVFWDDTRGEVVLFGGHNGSADLNDMWGWNGATWSQLNPANRPSARSRGQIATDAARDVTLLTGGSGLTDTWLWQNGNWTQAATSGTPPGQVWYDEATQQFTSFAPSGTPRGIWTGSGWNVQFGAMTTVGASAAPSFACGGYNPQQNGFVWFGGCVSGCRNDSGAKDTTHVIRQPALAEQLVPGAFPAARAFAGAAALPGASVGYLLGGKTPGSSTSFGGHWSWDGIAWTMIGSEDLSSGSRGRSGQALAPVSNTMFARIGGLGNGNSTSVDTYWSTDGTSWSWWAGSNPSTYYNEPYSSTRLLDQQMTYRPGVGGILYRGSKTSSTWTATYQSNYAPWNGGGQSSGILWTPLSTTGNPTSTSRHGFVYCANAGGSLLFGGYDGTRYLNETWVLNGSTWQRLSPAHNPPARGYHAMICDSGRGNVYIVGGTNGTQVFDDVWEWDGADWNNRTPSRRPQAREGAAMMYLPGLNQGVLAGGRDGSVFGDTWIWNGGSTSAPAHTFTAQFAEADVWSEATMLGVDSRWVSGGNGYTAGGAQAGVSAYVWDHGYWRPTGVTNSATTDAPETITWSTGADAEWSGYDAATRATRIRRLFTGVEHAVSVAVAPRGTSRNNPVGAVLASDYVEITVRYRLSD